MPSDTQSSSEPIEAAVFDLGGVLIDFDFERANSAAAKVSGLHSDEVRRRLFSSPDFLAFERGTISPQGFHQSLEALLESRMPYELFSHAWTSIFNEEIEPTVSLLRSLRARSNMKVGLLSNTNVLHFDYLRARMSVLREMDYVYASHEIGCRKPDAEAFQHVLKGMNVAPQRTVFIDDLEENIAAARALGIRVIHATNAAAVQAGLRDLGLA